MFKQRRRKPYYFTDDSVASDTVISFCMGGLALLFELIAVIASVKTAGHVPGIIGVMLLSALILSVVGFIFARFSLKSQKGSLGSKRTSALVCILGFVIVLVFLIL